MFGRPQARVACHQSKRIAPRFTQDFPVGEYISEAQLPQAMLPCAEEFAAAALARVEFGQCESVAHPHDGTQPFLGLLGHGFGEEVALSGNQTTADAAAHLMKLRSPEAFGVFNDHERRVRHIYSDLYNRSTHEQVEF